MSGSLLDRRAESGSLIIDDSEDVSLAVSTPKKAKGRCKKPFQSNKQLNRLLTQYDYVLYAMQPSQSKQDIHEMFCLGQVHFVIEHQTNHSADNLSTFGISNNSANVAYIGCQKEEPSCDILLNESGMWTSHKATASVPERILFALRTWNALRLIITQWEVSSMVLDVLLLPKRVIELTSASDAPLASVNYGMLDLVQHFFNLTLPKSNAPFCQIFLKCMKQSDFDQLFH